METDTKEFKPCGGTPELDREVPLLVLAEHSLFPGVTQSLGVSDADSRALVDSLWNATYPLIVLALERDLSAALSGKMVPGEPGPVGVLARVLKTMGRVSGNHALALEGLERVRVAELGASDSFRTARVTRVPEVLQPDGEGAGLFERLRHLTRSAVRYMPELPPDAAERIDTIPDPGRLADLVAANLDFSLEERRAMLAAIDVKQRLRSAVAILTGKLDELRARESARRSKELTGLWPFETGAEERLERSVAEGRLTRDEAGEIRSLAEKGFVVWKGLIEPELIDALVADVRSIGDHPGCFVTTDHRNGLPFRYSGPDFDTYENIFDPYVNFESARAVCFHPKILRFLELLFDARPIAFQQLLFQRSHEHPLHQDTAYVCVDHPLQLVATWVALEDVVQGRGELTYFEGSHKIPHFSFRDGSKRFNAQVDDPDALSRHLRDQIRAMGCIKRDFLAKKGDVFLWSADLVHGSNPRTRPKAETRMSCVTHYCPETTRPFWFRVRKGNRGTEAHGELARIASSYYRLPKAPGIVRPSFLLPERPPAGTPAE